MASVEENIDQAINTYPGTPEGGNWEDGLEEQVLRGKVSPPADRELEGHGFLCLRCGRCCTSGLLVEILNPDLERLSRVMPVGKLVQRLADISEDPATPRFVLRQIRGRCIFYRRSGCMVYESRPLSCRAFPRKGDAVCIGSNLDPTPEMLSSAGTGDRESEFRSMWSANYYPEEVLSAWGRRTRPSFGSPSAGPKVARGGMRRRRGGRPMPAAA